ncbi:unnamed protein product [Cylicostephanus goldi]|uniref:Uncharacterized protein n=1 Tax=Cylicostephanus goldi TaxID=71465 RepID=A0A3P7PP23_CYLGO|nr:unnamed protein product [Cylicostephanus goldi]
MAYNYVHHVRRSMHDELDDCTVGSSPSIIFL